MNRFKLTLICIIIIVSCKKEEIKVQKYKAPNEVEPYVVRFENEAKKRGLNIDIHNSTIQFIYGDPTGGWVGMCSYGTDIITIDSLVWNTNGDDFERERVIFHELGHCYFDRKHLNDTMPKGEYKSMMFGGFTPFPPKNKFDYMDTNAITNRHSYYLDELFNINTPIPNWAK